MPDRLPAAGQRCWQKSSVFSAVFRFDAVTRFLTIRTATYGGPREEHEFLISDEAAPQKIVRMLVRNIDAGFAYSKARGRENQSNAHSSAVGGTRP